MNIIPLINQLHELSQKLQQENGQKFKRQLDRINDFFEQNDYLIKNPINERYTESRTDIEANIIGNATGDMKIVQVIKPIIYKKLDGQLTLIQKGIVIVS